MKDTTLHYQSNTLELKHVPIISSGRYVFEQVVTKTMTKLFIYTADQTSKSAIGKKIELHDLLEDTIDQVRFTVEEFKNRDDVKIGLDTIFYDYDDSGDDIFSQEVLTIKQNENLDNTFFYQEMRKALLPLY